MVRLFCFLLFLITSFTAGAQLIVNVENSRIQSDTTGWKGDVGTAFSFTQNVQQLLSVSGAMHLQYKTQKNLYLLIANYNLLKANQQNFSNNMFYHLRYNRKLSELVRWEAFTQWQQNSVTNIDLRALFGTGPRFRVLDSKVFKFYAGTLVMYEHERDKNPKIIYNDMRGDDYVTFTYKPNAVFDMTTTTFYQPLFRAPKDFRILNQVTFSIKATKHLSLTTSWDYSYDASPAVGTPNINYVIGNGINYTF
ncbi:DUF481 domain-containing protein [Segetibacter koreensis]|uniref:DUF481 domain-containing protein n=1 Tax=Segetibacter koreensis TaxID=398037 RepID=UPI0012FB8F72|nr:DUF481 domain-containing protein [Segetibacter koreensis]